MSTSVEPTPRAKPGLKSAAQRSDNRSDISAALAGKVAGHEWPRYIVVEGPIGVGKTTLANKLADTLAYPRLLEPVEDNPFLHRFYRQGRRFALPTQLYFLLHRAAQVAQLPENDLVGPLLVADFLIEKDRLFAEATLDENEFELYEQIHDNLALHPPKPDLVIYLQAPVGVLMDRIRSRGIDFEQNIESHYLENLANAYTRFFHFYDDAPLLVVNATEIDFAHNSGHFEALLDQILAMDGTRQYFNPHPTLL
ncbi:MAG: deoxynucleoside kinase [Proteobacteria bacterium]|nr:deoxynucleoside kinase [Pseudomonadota bacterium]